MAATARMPLPGSVVPKAGSVVRERPSDLPDFNRPPPVEVALGVQFEPLPQMRQGHVGLFWAEIHDQYPNARDLQPLDPAGETLDGETPVFTFQISDAPPLHRAWFISADQNRSSPIA